MKVTKNTKNTKTERRKPPRCGGAIEWILKSQVAIVCTFTCDLRIQFDRLSAGFAGRFATLQVASSVSSVSSVV